MGITAMAHAHLEQRITVIDVCRELGLKLRPALTWAIGNAVRDFFVARYGYLPEKNLREKTYATRGSHCFAIYPVHMREDIARIILAHAEQHRRQGNLF